MKPSLATMILSSTVLAAHAKHGVKHASRTEHLANAISFKPEVASMVKELHHTSWSQSLSNVLHGITDSPCEDPFTEYIAPLVSNIDSEVLQLVLDSGIDQIPLFYSLLMNQNESDEYFGTFGEETKEIMFANDVLKAFWGTADDRGGSTLDTSNILLLGMHGADMKDREKLIPTLELMYNLTDTGITYSELADEIQTIIVDNFPHEYDNPIFTFNAYASSDELFGGDRIVMGDGIIEYLHFKNLGYDGPEVVLSHEFGHQMQFEADIDYVGTLPEPLETRRYELMADAFSGYFLAHENGGNIRDHRVLELSEAASAVGDCDVESDGHHGTPRQRKCALTWGVNRATAANGTVLHPDELRALFDEDLRAMVDLDEDVCKLSLASPVGSGGLPGDNRSAPGAGEGAGNTTVTVTTIITKTETKTTTTETIVA